uniref:Uncharacterized protein n=2 Tax=Phlebotomus papatasi TaxID=29031 RepID=A0A1B0DRB6_PHLPP
ENLKNNRRTFKVLQKNAKDKENLVGRSIVPIGKEILGKQKAELEEEKSGQKKRKQTSQHVQTDSEESCDQQITEADLTSTAGPSQKYWEILAEKRRVALEDALKENEALHEEVKSLKAELDQAHAMLDETNKMVETLSEMIQGNEEAEEDADQEEAANANEEEEAAGE